MYTKNFQLKNCCIKRIPECISISSSECKATVLAMADFVGSTAAILNFAGKSEKKNFIVATESGIYINEIIIS